MFVYETTYVDTDNSNAVCEALAIEVNNTNQIPTTPDVIVFKSGDNTKVKVGSTVYPV